MHNPIDSPSLGPERKGSDLSSNPVRTTATPQLSTRTVVGTGGAREAQKSVVLVVSRVASASQS